MINIAGHVFVDPEDIHEFVAEARATVADGLSEDGCLVLSFCIDDPTQGSVVTLERWRSQHDIDLHLQKPAVRRSSQNGGPKCAAKYTSTTSRTTARPFSQTPGA